jgi:hypothetical protein
MKRLAVLLSVIAVLALILATGNYEINTYRNVGPSLSDGNWPPPPWLAAPAPPLHLADGNWPPPPWQTSLNILSA